MPLRNRVDPFQTIHAVSNRGAWFANRGVLHSRDGNIVRNWQLKRWIICTLEFKDRKRPLLQPGKYTELFFLDEATAFAAGHRPCKECRRDMATLFQKLAGFPSLALLDEELHRQRLSDKLETDQPLRFPDGTMFDLSNVAFLKHGEKLYQWSFDGYSAVEQKGMFKVLTPTLSVEILRLGYPIQIHESVHRSQS